MRNKRRSLTCSLIVLWSGLTFPRAQSTLPEILKPLQTEKTISEAVGCNAFGIGYDQLAETYNVWSRLVIDDLAGALPVPRDEQVFEELLKTRSYQEARTLGTARTRLWRKYIELDSPTISGCGKVEGLEWISDCASGVNKDLEYCGAMQEGPYGRVLFGIWSLFGQVSSEDQVKLMPELESRLSRLEWTENISYLSGLFERYPEKLSTIAKNRTVFSTMSIDDPGALEPVLVYKPDEANEDELAFNRETLYVSVNTDVGLGPIGKVFVPGNLGKELPQLAQVRSEWVFPSLITRISAAPIFSVRSFKDRPLVENVEQTDNQMDWMKVVYNLDVILKDETMLRCDSAGNPCAEYVQILEVVPDETNGVTKEHFLTRFASAASEVAGAVSPFFPASGFATRTSGAAKGLGVIFKGIFPAKSVATQYAFHDPGLSFGWYFRRDEKSAPSILGIHSGTVLLQVAKDVSELKVRQYSLSKWKNKANFSSKYQRTLREQRIEIPEAPDRFEGLTDLDTVPILLNAEQVEKITDLTQEEIESFIQAGRLTQVGVKITRRSVECLVGLRKSTDCQ